MSSTEHFISAAYNTGHASTITTETQAHASAFMPPGSIINETTGISDAGPITVGGQGIFINLFV